jgi:hypothetical protein
MYKNMRVFGRIILISVVGFVLWSCEKTKTYEIEYKVSGSSNKGYLVTYFDENNIVKQDTGADSGWRYKCNVEENFYFYLSALTNHDTSLVSVSLLINGEIYKVTSDTGYNITSKISGYIP